MSLKTLYKIWFMALVPAVLTCALYVAIATQHFLHNLPPGDDGDFAALPYLAYAHPLGIFCTGLYMTLLLAVWPKLRARQPEKLGAFVLWSHVAASLLLLATMNIGFTFVLYFFNPVAFVVFASLPYWCWQATQRQFNWRGPLIIGSIVLLLFLLRILLGLKLATGLH